MSQERFASENVDTDVQEETAMEAMYQDEIQARPPTVEPMGGSEPPRAEARLKVELRPLSSTGEESLRAAACMQRVAVLRRRIVAMMN